MEKQRHQKIGKSIRAFYASKINCLVHEGELIVDFLRRSVIAPGRQLRHLV